MMKKQWIAILLAGLLVMSLSACGKKQPASDPTPKDPNQQPSEPGDPNASDTPGTSDQEPVFPDSLARADAEVRLDELDGAVLEVGGVLPAGVDALALRDGNVQSVMHRLGQPRGRRANF